MADRAHSDARPASSPPAGATHQSLRLGYACSCTPFTDHPERRGKDFHAGTDRALQGMNDGNGGERFSATWMRWPTRAGLSANTTLTAGFPRRLAPRICWSLSAEPAPLPLSPCPWAHRHHR